MTNKTWYGNEKKKGVLDATQRLGLTLPLGCCLLDPRAPIVIGVTFAFAFFGLLAEMSLSPLISSSSPFLVSSSDASGISSST